MCFRHSCEAAVTALTLLRSAPKQGNTGTKDRLLDPT